MVPTKLPQAAAFKYTPAAETDIVATWRKFGYRPTTVTQRRARQTGATSDALAPVDVPSPHTHPRPPTLRLAAKK